MPGKNIRPLLGKPLLAYTIGAARESGVANVVAVSTDCQETAEVALSYGAEVVPRPTEIAGDSASTEAALIHALNWYSERGFPAEHVLTLQPTSPLRGAAQIRGLVESYFSSARQVDCLLSMNERREDFWLVEQGRTWRRLFPDAPRRSQDRSPLYEENSAIYLTRVRALRDTGSILGNSAAGYLISREEAVDINDELDLLWAEFLLTKQRKLAHTDAAPGD